VWFDGYDGDKVLIMDEFSPTLIRSSYLRRLLDVYRLQVPFKGGFLYALWHTVVITTNMAPWLWYQYGDTDEGRRPIMRRVTEIRRFYRQDGCIFWVKQVLDYAQNTCYDVGDPVLVVRECDIVRRPNCLVTEGEHDSACTTITK